MNLELTKLITELRASGLAFPCTMCKRMWRAKERGEDFCEAQRDGLRCVGPPSGGMFSFYDGPLSRHALASHCFACGKKSLMVLGTEDGSKGLGICKKHLPLVERIVPKDVFEEAKNAPDFDLDTFQERLRKA